MRRALYTISTPEMQAANRLCCILMIGISLLHLCDGYALNVQHILRQKFVSMGEELILDAMAKIREVENLRLKESMSTAYRQGELAYYARRKWGQMQKIYFNCVKKMDKMDASEIIRDLCRIQRMDMDIYHSTANMFQLEEDDVTINADWRRSGARAAGRSEMRQYLSSADAALRNQVRKRSEHLLQAHSRTKLPVFDFQEELNFLVKNESEVLVPMNNTEKPVKLDPEFAWPILYN